MLRPSVLSTVRTPEAVLADGVAPPVDAVLCTGGLVAIPVGGLVAGPQPASTATASATGIQRMRMAVPRYRTVVTLR